ncbi:MAG: class I SAM-dependent methyltransferase [Verrucomicrobiota bacterium]|nr:class I SAM-dependent methyltransferase [Verrucomicrobiota bacterium]
MSLPNETNRSRRWTRDSEPRYWWHRLPGMDFVPPIYSDLSEAEWEIVQAWYEETDRSGVIGECAVPLISLLHGLVMGNRISRIVQLGTCSGYSSLLLGFMLRRMEAPGGLFTLDIDPGLCAFAQRWLERAGLTNFVTIAETNSLDPKSVTAAYQHFGGPPQMVLLDSSHEYAATLQELELWYPALESGGLLLLHDVSRFAEDFDVTKQGGVGQALAEWRRKNPAAEAICLNRESRSMELPRPLYKDACGLGIIHKPGVPAPPHAAVRS